MAFNHVGVRADVLIVHYFDSTQNVWVCGCDYRLQVDPNGNDDMSSQVVIFYGIDFPCDFWRSFYFVWVLSWQLALLLLVSFSLLFSPSYGRREITLEWILLSSAAAGGSVFVVMFLISFIPGVVLWWCGWNEYCSSRSIDGDLKGEPLLRRRLLVMSLPNHTHESMGLFNAKFYPSYVAIRPHFAGALLS